MEDVQSLRQSQEPPVETGWQTSLRHDPLEQDSLTRQADPAHTVTQIFRPRPDCAWHISDRQSELTRQGLPGARFPAACAWPIPIAAATPPRAAPVADFTSERRESLANDRVKWSNRRSSIIKTPR